ncbi:MAG: ribonuclease J [Clostridia bacterium]|nr:ribonuclease J [Clostridia bacterium]
MKNKNTLKVRFLGGVGEIGKNITVLEYQKDIIIIDAGLTFPSDDMPGVDLVIPDFTYLIQNRERIKGLFLTHGHEDHIGAVPFLLKKINVPVYATKLTLSLLDNKLREVGVNKAKLIAVEAKSTVKVGAFSVEFINVNHSIAGAVAFAIQTPVGTVFHSGDFKVDLTPIGGEIIDLARLTEIGKKGVLLMLCESTNVERSGYSMSESVVTDNLDRLFLENKSRRIIIATFASNVYRLQQILNIAYKNKRKVALSGRSMLNVIQSAEKVKELVIPKDTLIDIEKIKNVPDKELVVVSTGSQGEPMSALTRMASGESSQVSIGSNDTIIISASPIPGNEKSIYQVINNLYRKGAEVVYESLEKIHASGHACGEELKIMHSLIRPRFFIPIHGEYRHLKKHTLLARQMGLKNGASLICEIGDGVELTQKTMRRIEKVPAGSSLVDGLAVGEAPSVVRDRKYISEEGIIVAVCCISAESGALALEPYIEDRGAGLDGNQINELKQIIIKTLSGYNVKRVGNKTEVIRLIRKNIRDSVYKKLKKNPMVLPIITEV